MNYYRPVACKAITQKFGENLNPIYKQLNLLGHNGVDFGTITGTRAYWYGSDKGTLIEIGIDSMGGNYCSVLTEEDGHFFRHRFFHLKEVVARVGQVLGTGDLLCITDNTGTATTGPHLHCLDIKEVVKDLNGNWQSINKDNGYGGSIDPTPKLKNIYVLEVLENMKAQISILQKIKDLLSNFIKGRK